MLVRFFAISTQTRVLWEERSLTERLPSTDCLKASHWDIFSLDDWCGRAQPTWVVHVVLGGIKKQEEQTRGIRHSARFFTSASVLDWLWAMKDERNPFLSKMLLVRVFIPRSRLEPMFTIHWVFSHPLYYDIVDTFLLSYSFSFWDRVSHCPDRIWAPCVGWGWPWTPAVLSLLQNAGIQECSTGPGSVIESWIQKNTMQEFSFHSFCLCFPSRVLSVLQSPFRWVNYLLELLAVFKGTYWHLYPFLFPVTYLVTFSVFLCKIHYWKVWNLFVGKNSFKKGMRSS